MKLFLFLSFNALMLLEAFGNSHETDKQALLKFKYQVSEEKKVLLSSWNNSSPLCKWTGVTCGRKNERVTGLELGGFQLGGVISPSIGNLSFLISINFTYNSFGGTIPQDLGNLFRLQYLDMSFNFLGGGIPASLFNCSRLLNLALFSNHLGQGLPSELGSLSKLVTLELGQNHLKGKLPVSLGNLTSLRKISLTDNNLEGEIPDTIARLTQMVFFVLHNNHFSGVFPPAIYNLSSLQSLGMYGNDFSGNLRPDFGNLLPNLREFSIGSNSFTGAIPLTLANISTLQYLVMEFNSLTGRIPSYFAKLQYLQTLSLSDNSLGGFSVGDLEFLITLTNCTGLQILDVSFNKLGGDLPVSIANLSMNLTMLSLRDNFISGSIPNGIGNLIGLQALVLSGNLLTGPIPASLGKLSGLMGLSVHTNRMSGEIPYSLGNITRKKKNTNEATPATLGIFHEMISYGDLRNATDGFSSSNLIGSGSFGTVFKAFLPAENKVVAVKVLNMQRRGAMKSFMAECESLKDIRHRNLVKLLTACSSIDFQGNEFRALIYEYMPNGSLDMWLHPKEMEEISRPSRTLRLLERLNIAIDVASVLEYLHVSCHEAIAHCDLKPSNVLLDDDLTAHVSDFGLARILLKFDQETFINQLSSAGVRGSIGYAAPDGFSSSNLIGSGSFGTVFKAFLPAENKVVAVKVLNMQRRGAMKSFMAECESLKDIRHRNLVKLLTACSSIDFQGNEFRALIYEYMPNGSLDMWLHPKEMEEISRPSRTLRLLERLNIAIDVASVLEYLHVSCHEAIAHCDLKPSNVLLDDDLTAHVSDFGLARILLKFDQETFINQLSSAGVRGSIGYAAPEYAMGGEISVHGDAYSFGILILEMFSGKRPTDEMFGGDFTLRSCIKSALPEQVLDVADELVLHNGLRVGFPAAECLTKVLEVGLGCSEEPPANRLGMSEVVKELISIKERFFEARRGDRH
ncbi:hypothetical protein F2Q68_00000843 [Brassica cretica]|uniref:non-specific serine/threonine protein kinase n=1 Tax=Brassica cretica TaxID=69181 RepID=A0A8S9JA02_BRACR|nr:hypothetical protein F2Q68_00000843 [Brassica cretica]